MAYAEVGHETAQQRLEEVRSIRLSYSASAMRWKMHYGSVKSRCVRLSMVGQGQPNWVRCFRQGFPNHPLHRLLLYERTGSPGWAGYA